jgi:hypothetical protein
VPRPPACFTQPAVGPQRVKEVALQLPEANRGPWQRAVDKTSGGTYWWNATTGVCVCACVRARVRACVSCRVALCQGCHANRHVGCRVVSLHEHRRDHAGGRAQARRVGGGRGRGRQRILLEQADE